jgi:hypothetical protein
VGTELAQGRLLATLGGGETVYEELFPAEGPTVLARKGVVTLDCRATDDWPLSITWEIAQTYDGDLSSGRVSLLGAALSRGSGSDDDAGDQGGAPLK